MKTYAAVLRIRFATGLQYRAAALGGLVTQFFWGALEILAFAALYRGGQPQPMTFPQLASYIWLQQAFLVLVMPWVFDAGIFTAIEQGDIAYELCRPMDLYGLWFARTAAQRISGTLLRCAPILLVAAFLPAPYGLMAPPSIGAFCLFLTSLCLTFFVVVSVTMIIYAASCWMLSARGIRFIMSSIIGFLAGEFVPLPFFPAAWRNVLSYLPFGAMQNMPLRIYSGNIAGAEALRGMLLQAIWALLLIGLGRLLLASVLRRVQVQGG